VKTDAYRELKDIGIVFHRRPHSEEQVRFDYGAFEGLLGPRGTVLFHDSMVVRPDKVYGAEKGYEMRVKYFIDHLKTRSEASVVRSAFWFDGLTLLRKLDGPFPGRFMNGWTVLPERPMKSRSSLFFACPSRAITNCFVR